MFYFTYKTVNEVNGKWYLGRHHAESLDDGYLGSGVALKRAIDKYGKENFTRTVLEFYPSKEALVEAEKTLITEDVVNDVMSYNMKVGGWGGSTINEWSDKRRENMAKATKKRMVPEMRKRLSTSLKKAWAEGRLSKVPPNMTGTKMSQETKNKISKRHTGMKKPWVNGFQNIGRLASEETKRKMSESRKGERNAMANPENRKKVGMSKIGRRKMVDLSGKGYYVKGNEIEYKLSLGWKMANAN